MKAQAAYDVIVVGAGLAGLLTGVWAARRGARTLVIARGQGGTQVGPGCIDVWGYDPAGGALADEPEAHLRALPGEHPLALAGLAAVRAGLGELKALGAAAGYPLLGELSRNFKLPTAMGAVRPTCLAPQMYVAGDLGRSEELALARFATFRDFYADLAAANLNAAGYAARAVTLDLPELPPRRDAFATDLARLFDQPAYRATVAQAWRGALKGVRRLGLPAVLGLRAPVEAQRDLAEKLGMEIFEIPILPPSVPGLRLYTLLREALLRAGGHFVLGPRVSGWVEAGRALGVVSAAPGSAHRYAAPRIILATGGFRHGGLEAPARGEVAETVFNLPVAQAANWFAPFYLGQQPYARFGVRVNARLQPVDAAGAPCYPNVWAVGGLLAGADRLSEGSREGIDLATAWVAAAGQN